MLAAGGMPVLSDGVRSADKSNPAGYFELEATKTIGSDSLWFEYAKGKAVKIVVPLVGHLPARHAYKVIFMRRDMDEIMRSQEKMLDRLGTPGEKDKQRGIALYYEEQTRICRETLAALPRCDILTLDYAEAVADPSACAARIACFLSNPAIKPEAMQRAVEPSLHREKTGRRA